MMFSELWCSVSISTLDLVMIILAVCSSITLIFMGFPQALWHHYHRKLSETTLPQALPLLTHKIVPASEVARKAAEQLQQEFNGPIVLNTEDRLHAHVPISSAAAKGFFHRRPVRIENLSEKQIILEGSLVKKLILPPKSSVTLQSPICEIVPAKPRNTKHTHTIREWNALLVAEDLVKQYWDAKWHEPSDVVEVILKIHVE